MAPTPYGAWPSPVTAADVAGGGREFGALALDDDVYWLERRPSEGGRGVIMRAAGDGGDATGPVEVTPEAVDVRTLVHEYGGGDFAVHDGTVWYAGFEDQRVYRVTADGDPDPVTPEPPDERAIRYADFTVAAGGDRLYCVRERHGAAADGEEPTNELVCLPADGSGDPRVVASGHDFYAAPRPAPGGEQLAWLTWDHPRMPWDGTDLHVAEVAGDGRLTGERVVLGGPEEAVFQPAWSPAGSLHAVSDRTGYWNLYRLPGGDPEAMAASDPENRYPADAEFGAPNWLFGLATYGFLEDGRVACVVTENGRQRLALLDGDDLQDVDLPYTSFRPPMMRVAGRQVAFIAASPRTPSSVVHGALDDGHAETRVLRTGEPDGLADRYVSTPDHITYPTDGTEAHLLYYPPTNPDVDPPDSELPPLLVTVHGGPTSARYPAFELETQFWTSRGFAVAAVNYRGSTGYGRDYRRALYGEWGTVDVIDCVNAARYLAAEGLADGDRLAVSGGSAGGFVVLAALAFHDVFDAGTSYYGVADLRRLATMTHKFESHYLEQLVGPLPDAEATYRERSPVNHASGVDAPVLLLQGADDPVVPLDQAESMVESLAAAGTPHELVVFDGERHGFRREDSRREALEAELGFYAGVFGFEPAGGIEPRSPDDPDG